MVRRQSDFNLRSAARRIAAERADHNAKLIGLHFDTFGHFDVVPFWLGRAICVIVCLDKSIVVVDKCTNEK